MFESKSLLPNPQTELEITMPPASQSNVFNPLGYCDNDIKDEIIILTVNNVISDDYSSQKFQ